MKFVFSTDQHVRGTNPKARKDFFPDTILEKMKEVNQIALEIGAKAQLFGGDLYDRADTAPSVARKANLVLRESPCPVYTSLGNHSIFSYNPESAERAMIGTVESAGLINFLSMDEPVIFEENGVVVGITGCHSHAKLDKGGRIEDYCPKKPDGVDILIHVMHSYLSTRKRLEDIPHTVIDDIVDITEADIILTGHEHIGFGVVKIRNKEGKLKIFCNPGALAGISASLEEMKRTIQVAIVDIKDADNYDVTLRPLKCAKPREEVLDREELEKQIEKEKQIKEFTSSLSDFIVDKVNIHDIIEKIAEECKLPKNVVDEAMKRIQQAEEQIASELNQELGE